VEIRSLIKTIGQQKTVIFSTHIMQEVTAICDRVVIINKGQIVADSDVAALTSGSQQEVYTLAEFESPVDRYLLEQVPGMIEVQLLNATTYRLRSQKGSDIRSAVFGLAALHKWSLIGLRQEEHSLEKIFQSLTK
jgi:ABC-2 type transport system ATP-binding protein